MVARDLHRWRELIHQEVRGADGAATPLHRWVAGTGAPSTTSSRQHLVPCLWQLLIGRDWYQLSAWNLTEVGCCRHCGTRCAGRFQGPPEG